MVKKNLYKKGSKANITRAKDIFLWAFAGITPKAHNSVFFSGGGYISSILAD